MQALSLDGGIQAWSLAWNTAELPLERSDAHLIQVRRTGKGCLSYIIGSDGEALVIDPSIDPQVYVDQTNKRDRRITKVIDTHIHADHLSGGRSLVELTGAAYYLSQQDRLVHWPSSTQSCSCYRATPANPFTLIRRR